MGNSRVVSGAASVKSRTEKQRGECVGRREWRWRRVQRHSGHPSQRRSRIGQQLPAPNLGRVSLSAFFGQPHPTAVLVRVSPSNSCSFFSHSSHRSSIAATIGYGSIKYQYKHTVQVASRAPLAVPHNFVCTSLARAVCRNRGMLSPM